MNEFADAIWSWRREDCNLVNFKITPKVIANTPKVITNTPKVI